MSEPTKNGILPPLVEAYRLTKQGRNLQGLISLDDLQRLPEVVESIDQPIKLDLQFSVDEQSRHVIEGRIACSLTLVCQRCLETMPLDIGAEVDLVMLRYEDQAAALPKNTEWLVVEGETLDLVALVEDEVILALPTIASHPEGECQAPKGKKDTVVEKLQPTSKSNPFDVLEALKTKH